MANEKCTCNQICRWNDSSDGCIKPYGRNCPMSNTEPDASGWGQVQVVNEERLIYANALDDAITVDYFEHFTQCHDTDQIALIDMVRECIGNAPTVDAVKVVHARWENVQNGKGCCSNCNRLDSIDNLATHCRYCGAKMDGGNENG